ncbi:MAG: DEAD/DEAH box helicase [Patescibacteria group bacterium]
MHKHTPVELETACANVFNKPISFTPEISGVSSVSLILNSKVVLNRSKLTPQLIHFLKEKLNFISTEYLTKKRLGKSVYKVQKFFKLLEEDGDNILLPRGFLTQLISFLRDNRIAYQLKDKRPQIPEVKFTSNIKLLPAQQPIVTKALEVDSGVIVAPSGSGKTIIGLEIIAQRKLPALILVHRKQLLDQWIERMQSFLGIPKKDIGQYYSVKKKTGEEITVAMMQTLVRVDNFTELQNKFGTIIVDECHHIPAKTFREVISQLNPKYIYGLTATPKRKHNDESLIYMFIGDIIAQMEQSPEIKAETATLSYKPVKTQIIVRETNLEVPFKFTTDNFQLLAKLICFDTNRNQMIVKDIMEQTSQSKKVLFLSERRDHLEILNLYLKGQCEIITISGEDSNAKRAIKLKQIHTGHYQAILSTGQFFGEGLDIPNIDCLIIAFPFSFEGKLIQYIGRMRGKDNQKTIIDYEDKKIAFLERQFKLRKRYYNKIS